MVQCVFVGWYTGFLFAYWSLLYTVTMYFFVGVIRKYNRYPKVYLLLYIFTPQIAKFVICFFNACKSFTNANYSAWGMISWWVTKDKEGRANNNPHCLEGNSCNIVVLRPLLHMKLVHVAWLNASECHESRSVLHPAINLLFTCN